MTVSLPSGLIEVTRETRVADAQRLHAQGLNGIQIADEMGLSRSYVYALLSDPEGAEDRDRKAKGDGVCVDCGGRTRGDGSVRKSERCLECAQAHASATAVWTRETVVAAMRQWDAAFGKRPVAQDWNATHASPESLRRYRAGHYPATRTVQCVFGTWNKAIIAAGFKPDPRGTPGRLSPGDLARTRELHKAGRSLTEIASEFGVTSAAIAQRLERMGARQRSIRRDSMAAPLKAEQIIEREIDRAEIRLQTLAAEAADARDTIARLKAAREALNAVPALKAA